MRPERFGGELANVYTNGDKEFDSENMKENRKAGEAHLKRRTKKNPKGEERANQ